MPKAIPQQSVAKKTNKQGVSGLDCLSRGEWLRAVGALDHFDACMDVYLEAWAVRMRHAGYLSYTTARRDDCVASCKALLDPLKKHRSGGCHPQFEHLRTNADGWADALKASGLRHWRRGVTGGMFLGCFKTFRLALHDALAALPGMCPEVSATDAALATRLIDIYGDAFELVWLDACVLATRRAQNSDHDDLFRLLTLEKCRFENVFNATSDGALVMDSACRITTANRSLRQYAGENLVGNFIWDALGLPENSPEAFFSHNAVGQTVEISPFGNGLVFRLSMASLGDLSLASCGEFLVLLTNITPHVLQREMLEEAVQRQTQDLLQEKQRLEEMNITLRNVLRHVEEERREQCQDLSGNIRSFLWPALAELDNEQNPVARSAAITLVREQLDRILAGMGSSTEQLAREKGMNKLTLAELKICQLIQTGRSSKEIAAILRISPETVQTHRRNIRRKLGVRGHDTQLAVYLISNQT
jgi:DNA-binding CsgD family transcriptional regulator